VDESGIHKLLLKRYGLRVRPEMGRYLLRRMQKRSDGTSDGTSAATSDGAPQGAVIAVMGGDARTGVAIRQLIAADELSADELAAAAASSTPAGSTATAPIELAPDRRPARPSPSGTAAVDQGLLWPTLSAPKPRKS
jgi:hypothetical protein